MHAKSWYRQLRVNCCEGAFETQVTSKGNRGALLFPDVDGSSAPSRFKSDLLAFGRLVDSVETVIQFVGFRPDPIRIRSILAAGTFLGPSISLLRNEL